ncbi:MAG: hypothetical protein GW803_03810 [Caldiserica bacterium]|nr:hypothetical protein [Caldisericota bacterium]
MIREIFQRFENLVRNGRMSLKEKRLFEDQEILVEESSKVFRGCFSCFK